jgi:hypothetical protein
VQFICQLEAEHIGSSNDFLKVIYSNCVPRSTGWETILAQEMNYRENNGCLFYFSLSFYRLVMYFSLLFFISHSRSFVYYFLLIFISQHSNEQMISRCYI